MSELDKAPLEPEPKPMEEDLDHDAVEAEFAKASDQDKCTTCRGPDGSGCRDCPEHLIIRIRRRANGAIECRATIHPFSLTPDTDTLIAMAVQAQEGLLGMMAQFSRDDAAYGQWLDTCAAELNRIREKRRAEGGAR